MLARAKMSHLPEKEEVSLIDEAMGFFGQMFDAAAEGLQQATIGAQQAACKAKIAFLENEIEGAKKDFGIEVWDAVMDGNLEERDKILASTKTQIWVWKAEIDAERREYDDLERESQAVEAKYATVAKPPALEPCAQPSANTSASAAAVPATAITDLQQSAPAGHLPSNDAFEDFAGEEAARITDLQHPSVRQHDQRETDTTLDPYLDLSLGPE